MADAAADELQRQVVRDLTSVNELFSTKLDESLDTDDVDWSGEESDGDGELSRNSTLTRTSASNNGQIVDKTAVTFTKLAAAVCFRLDFA